MIDNRRKAQRIKQIRNFARRTTMVVRMSDDGVSRESEISSVSSSVLRKKLLEGKDEE